MSKEEFDPQKRVYEGMAKPLVESVLNGYNRTVMAYGQTDTLVDWASKLVSWSEL
ncbi:hypothetical protein JCGZ_11963 [Jatropha curcas]|uniref:Kinesin motor domain-containing protein n=1 Tax=Jatropha curcas TaxID=180498 RepID=A0A067KQU5_JATCU|nr:hypothetical protein JCGZ_11963 [Jatropha curcas]